MAGTLRGAVLHKYTYDDIKRLCFTEGSTFGNVFDCEWGVWRDKAVVDFNISPQFFDLITVLSGPQRYLQIASYVKLTPLSGVRIYKDIGVIEGVYEALAGFTEAYFRRDPEMLLWFANRVRPEQERELQKRPFASWNKKKEALETIKLWEDKEKEPLLYYPPEDGAYSFAYLALVLEQGRLDILDKIIHRYFTLPEGFSIEKDIPYTPFWELENNPALYDLPLQDTPEQDFVALISPILLSGDTRIADFFRSIFRDRDFNTTIAEDFLSGYGCLRYHHKPEEAYGMDLRFLNKESYNGRGLGYDYMVESLLYALSHDEQPKDNDRLEGHIGNIPYLQTLLAHVPYGKEKLQEAIFPGSEVLYPLSYAVIQEYL
ncbi:Hypothetical protein BRZCDTV_326 [Brazilian cedratvirus IHUMI]|uniref:Uncharacterized protein n=1 Tax=Brazilian cedratvirus IHUMI TaxID=2126980 RepID=A0A2R8FEJ3_9VIRU|nr:Hypothetical protein BRZCDTV_326 [Brazilian cedratvirus IHUMI]